MKSPAFLKVLPADIGRVGAPGACILAAIRYVTALPGEGNGRRVVDGETWLRASQEAIGQLLGGVPRKSIGRELAKLEAAGELQTRPSPDYGDQAKEYLVSDQPVDESGQSIAQNRPLSLAESGHSHWPKVATLPIPEELEEHSVGKNARTRGARLDPEWIPPQNVIDQMRDECPTVDLQAEHRKFVDYWTDQTGSRAAKRSWVGTWRNWIRKAAEQSRGPRTGVATADQRVAQVQALKHTPPTRLEISQ
ncbi:hypothetical protein NGTWS0302_16940 [Mycolicibacterium cyprinidarum]|uniref:Helix-turn-helix domain-containing protein n=1 Tax=Mycolicibacterium cyprinidarum TaxID=2860311 RepID=A0ABQ4VBH6_9MYCO|nr:hypothetical protein NGTWS1702_24610 [Mycolicibacterium sp. NGTWSNA01]GJF18570.1 hypothetical protein NGTWS0302_16940 [Mycolicibacterium sp. NGTWS0302]